MKKTVNRKLTLRHETLRRLIGGLPEYGPGGGGIQPASQNSVPPWHCWCDNTGATPIERTPLK